MDLLPVNITAFVHLNYMNNITVTVEQCYTTSLDVLDKMMIFTMLFHFLGCLAVDDDFYYGQDEDDQLLHGEE